MASRGINNPALDLFVYTFASLVACPRTPDGGDLVLFATVASGSGTDTVIERYSGNSRVWVELVKSH